MFQATRNRLWNEVRRVTQESIHSKARGGLCFSNLKVAPVELALQASEESHQRSDAELRSLPGD